MRLPLLAEAYRRAGHWRPETFPQRFASVCRGHAGRVAIIDGEARLTFAAVAGQVARAAAAFRKLGVRPGDVVSWQLPNWWEAVVVHHGVLAAGAIPNPVNVIYRARELRFVLGEARPRVFVVPRRFRRHDHAATAAAVGRDVGSIEHVVTVRGEASGCVPLEALLGDEAAGSAHPSAHPGDVALLLYTSGTTGDPKGVQHTHETLLYEIDSLRDVHAVTPEDRYLGGSPVAHIAGLVYTVLMPFALGTSTVLLDRWDARRALGLIARERATFQTGVPAFLQSMAEARRAEDLSSFRLFSTGGASITSELIRDAGSALGCAVKRAYGSTEVPTLTATRVDDPEDLRLSTDGRAIGPAEMRIVRPDGTEAAPEDEGEIRARSPEVFAGYRDPALDAECFDAEGWYRTGDRGVVDANGFLRVTGRLKDIVIRGGENISAKEIEDLLAEHPAVGEVAVVGMPDALLGERACAFVQPRRGARLTFEEMAAFLASREIARQKIPERLEVRARLPRTSSGKVRKNLLREEIRRLVTGG